VADEEDVLVVEDRDSVRVLRLNRPEARNALNPPLISALGRALVSADDSPDVRAIVVTGTGNRAFCAGLDLRNFAQGGDRGAGDEDAMAGYSRFNHGQMATPVIGAANATAVAGGFEILLACDMVVASEDAVFGMPEVKRGLLAAGGGMHLGRRMPLAVALELGLTGDTIDARRAEALGLVNRVVPADQVLDAAVALAERIAANGPLAVTATKHIMYAVLDVSRQEAWDLQQPYIAEVFASDDAKEGALAFVEKRAPNWTGH
jgi:enoyl-CoA hydratase